MYKHIVWQTYTITQDELRINVVEFDNPEYRSVFNDPGLSIPTHDEIYMHGMQCGSNYERGSHAAWRTKRVAYISWGFPKCLIIDLIQIN